MITQFSQIPQGFFGENGLTATSASHIADLCKLRYQRLENDLASLNYITEKISIIGSNTENISKTPIIMSDEEIIEKINKIARYKGFIAFLREAVKCKTLLANEIANYQSELPERPFDVFKRLTPLSEESVIANMSIGERVKYLTAEARAATYGKYIHPDGILDANRQKVFAAFKEPTTVAMAGRDTVIIKRESVVSTSEIDAVLLKLQVEQRKSEAELNGYKHLIHDKIKADEQAQLDAECAARLEYNKALDEYNRKVAEINEADQQARIDRREVVEALKIVVPTMYKDLYDEVNG